MYKDVINRVDGVNKNLNYVGFSKSVINAVDSSIMYFFPGYFLNEKNKKKNLDSVKRDYTLALSYVYDDVSLLKEKLEKFINKFDLIYKSIICDIDAAFRGDPASSNYDEIILTYPGFKAVYAYRIAHELFVLDVPILPRAISEYTHSITGIDIHPGAQIGRYFFIDHGTGVIIGETTIIGDNVTIYQNATLGAKSFPHDDDGNLIKGIKRHPNIGDNVVIYAGATILGDISIGDNCTIGGNTWLTESVNPGTTITI